MKLSDYRIGNWVENSYGTIIQLGLKDLQLIYDESDESRHPKPIILTEAWLLDFDWPCDRKVNNDNDGLWIKDGITIYQSAWTLTNFSYATYVKGDGEFKGGWIIKYVHNLQNLYHALSNKEVIRNAYYTK